MGGQAMSVCPVCGKEFPVEFNRNGELKRFDSEACQKKYYYEHEGSAARQEMKEARARIEEMERRLEASEAANGSWREHYDEQYRQLRILQLDVAKACEDMRLMFDRGVLGVNTRSPNYPMLAGHSGFLKLIDKYEDHRPAQVIAEEKALDEQDQKQRREWRQAQLRGIAHDEQTAMRHRQLKERSTMLKRCRHWKAWRGLEDAQLYEREQYGVELGDDDPMIRPYLDILRDGRPAFQ